MLDSMNSLFNDTQSIGVIPESDHHNHIITEAVILDRVNGNKDAYAKVLAEVGAYAVRDNLLESAQLSEACCSEECGTMADYTSVLATAKEAGDSDYSTYCKAYALTKKLMADMKARYGATAEARVASINKEIDNSPRLVNSINNANTSFADTCMR